MKDYRAHALVCALALVAAAALVSFAARTNGQSQAERKGLAPEGGEKAAGLQPTAVVRGRAPVAEAAAGAVSAFGAAAAQNALLSQSLNWTFGGKRQRGWSLYTPLITRLVGHEGAAADTPDFASALARWQQAAGLRPSGVLDDGTLLSMVSAWQGVRLKAKGYPTPDQLVLVPAADFYDPARPEELRQVEREAYAAYKRMVAAACADRSLGLRTTAAGGLAPDERFLKIVSAFRSREYQARLRKESPHSGRAGLAVNSPHFTGRALDLYVGGDPVETKDENRAVQVNTPVYRWLVRNADKFGFRPYYYEPWHWEYVGETPAADR